MVEKITSIKCGIFYGFTQNEISKILSSFPVNVMKYDAGEYIHIEGDNISTIGIIISGGVNILKEDYDGNTNIISTLSEGDIFAEVFVLAGLKEIPVTVGATVNSEIIHINYKIMIEATSKLGNIHTRLIDNLLRIVSRNALALNRKLQIISKKTTRSKILEYLYSQSKINKSNKFSIIYNRDELASYLCVDRSALSRELSSMKRDGLIYFNKNNFELIN